MINAEIASPAPFDSPHNGEQRRRGEAKKGDPLALLAFERTGRLLGHKLADIVAHTNPEAIFLFGGLAQAGEILFKPAIDSMEENLLSIYKGKVRLLASQLNAQNAAVLGASSLIWSNEKI